MYGPAPFLYSIFIILSIISAFYTLNFFYLAYQSRRNVRHERAKKISADLPADEFLPIVTVQLPLYNERYVAKRLIDAVCNMDYPRNKLQIQVLDDSDDDTVEIIRDIVGQYRVKGFDISHVHRVIRTGYKAGALKAAMKYAAGEFVAIFDADFIPPPTFLRKSIKHFFAEAKLGLVQCKWGHVNEKYSTLTEAQAVSLDLHFLVEQKAKSMTHLFMNFNGTAGIWRASCIADSGGWHTGTLVEDLDLSYRAQMKGWKCIFLEELVIDAELPVQMNAAKRQQFRWSKGSIQVAAKLLADIAIQRKLPSDTKIQAFVQMTRPIVNALFLAQFLILPMLLAMNFKLYNSAWGPVAVIVTYLMMGPLGYIFAINRVWGGKKVWQLKARQFFFLMLFATGISVTASVAVFDALFGRKNEFLRTPKFGVINRTDNWRNKEYVLPFTKTTLLEIFFAVYGLISVFIAIFSGNPVYAPILAISTAGFLYVSFLSISHSSFKRKKKHGKGGQINYASSSKELTITTDETTSKPLIPNIDGPQKSVLQRLFLPGVIAFLIFGGAIAFVGYQKTIYPLSTSASLLVLAESSQTPDQMAEYANIAKEFLPQSGNPVWLFPTPRTDYSTIQQALSEVVKRSDAMSTMVPHSEEYNTEMSDLRHGIEIVKANIQESIPYSYISISNMLIGGVWVGAILMVFALTRRTSLSRKPLQYKTV